jgi:5-methyltetrahydrofolate--homocysteine methyltransferase
MVIFVCSAMAEKYPPRKRHPVEPLMRLSGLEPLNYRPNPENMRSTFLKIGERCNVAGSIMYKKAIVDGNYDKAASIATKQVRGCSSPGSLHCPGCFCTPMSVSLHPNVEHPVP